MNNNRISRISYRKMFDFHCTITYTYIFYPPTLSSSLLFSSSPLSSHSFFIHPKPRHVCVSKEQALNLFYIATLTDRSPLFCHFHILSQFLSYMYKHNYFRLVKTAVLQYLLAAFFLHIVSIMFARSSLDACKYL